ncbi:MAG: hypothetical protein P8L18_13855 [Verrucomicrobiota bacterium]|nr:hypothetical protein [Verrucomicrobiota bacterium]
MSLFIPIHYQSYIHETTMMPCYPKFELLWKLLTIHLLTFNLGTAEVVTQWSFEQNLEDTAQSGIENDTLKPFGEPAYAPGVPGLGGTAVNITADGLQRLRAKDSWDLDLEESWTLEAFVWPDENNNGEWDRLWLKWGDGGNQWHFALRSFGSVDVENGLDFVINGGTWIFESNDTAEVPLSSWSHVALVGDSAANTMTAWLNGKMVGESEYKEVKPGNGAVNFGNFQSPANSLQYSGLIDEALIHDAAVSEAYLKERSALRLPSLPPTDIKISSSILIVSSVKPGLSVGAFTVTDANEADQHVIDLVAGEGDTHNSLFMIDGNQLLAATSFGHFKGNTLSIRLQAKDTTELTCEKILNLSVGSDSDTDGLLDSWELTYRESLNDLGNAGDFDKDNLSDENEFKLGTDPTMADTDGDGLDDATEVSTLTNPAEADTDGDGLTDGEEINGVIKTDPTSSDTDADGFEDLAELTEGTDPNDANQKPFRSIVHMGEVDIFNGPDDLDLDGEIIYAINCFSGDHGQQGGDLYIRGIDFISDDSEEIEGYTTTGDTGGNWTSYNFTNGNSADNKEFNALMKGVRCCGAPTDTYTFAVNPGDTYKIQVLWGENDFNATKRIWDIAFEGAIAVDDVASNGLIEDETAPRTSASDGTRWSHAFTAGDNSAEIEIGQIQGGVAGEDHRYSVSAFILSRIGSAEPGMKNISLVDDAVIIEYSGTLKSANKVSGPYTPVDGASSPHTAPVSKTAEFFLAE